MSVVKFKRLHPDAVAPVKATPGAAAFDLHAIEDGVVRPGEVVAVDTGLAVELPEHFSLHIIGRSGLALRFGVGVAQGVGLVDPDFRGPIKVLLRTEKNFWFKRGDRIAQAEICLSPTVFFTEADELTETDRGAGGFGSTGN